MDKLIFNTLLILTLIIMYLYFSKKSKMFGRPTWYSNKKLISWESDGKDTSQQPFDIYSFTHFSSGILVYLICKYLNFTDVISFYITVILALVFEVVENTPYVIKKYRENKEYKNYTGDSMANITGDIISLVLGIYFYKTFPEISPYYLVITEILLSNYKASMYDLASGIIKNM